MHALLVSMFVGAMPDAGMIAAVEIAVTPFERRLDEAPKVAGLGARAFFVERGGHTFAADNEGPNQQQEQWRLWSVVEKKPVLLGKAGTAERAVGLAWHEGALRLAVVRPDGSNAYSVNERAEAMVRGDGKRLAMMAGPLEGAVIALGTDGKERARERLTEQRPAGLCATGDGWLVLVTEGTLAKGLGDAMVMARRPGATEAWERFASDVQMPGQLVCRGAWACFSEMTAEGTFLAHCVSPSKGAHVKSKAFKTNVILREVVAKPSWGLVFTELSVTGGVSPQWLLPLR